MDPEKVTLPVQTRAKFVMPGSTQDGNKQG